MNIDKLRNEIDKIDDEILELIEKRYRLVQEVGKIKKTSYSSVFVPEREKAILERLSRKASSFLPQEAILAIFREMMSGARFVEHPITIVYLKGDLLSIQAAYSKFGSCIKLKPLPNLGALLSEAKNKLNTYAVITHTDYLDSELKILTEISIENPETPSKNLTFLVIGR